MITTPASNDNGINYDYKDINSVNIYFPLIVISKHRLIQLSLTEAPRAINETRRPQIKPDQGYLPPPPNHHYKAPYPPPPHLNQDPFITQASDFLVFSSLSLESLMSVIMNSSNTDGAQLL